MHSKAQKVADAAQALGVEIEILEYAETTRSAQEAAGTPFAVFAIAPDDLVRGSGGTAVSLKKNA